ncbi:hypothetical protein BZA77DRAFT_324038 [Pyronema omphalodes]|nr:hypothetical protein BZA77DRAFT_324038 [Pyronema omphalodes]
MRSAATIFAISLFSTLGACSFGAPFGQATAAIAKPGGNNIGNTLFNNLDQEPSLIQIKNEPEDCCCPEPCSCPAAKFERIRDLPILANVNQQNPTYFPPQARPCRTFNPCYEPCSLPCCRPEPCYREPCFEEPCIEDPCDPCEDDEDFIVFLNGAKDCGCDFDCDCFSKK